MRIATLNDFQLNSFTLFFGVDFQTLDFGWLALFLTVVILNVVQRSGSLAKERTNEAEIFNIALP